jgi:hypothetical protein
VTHLYRLNSSWGIGANPEFLAYPAAALDGFTPHQVDMRSRTAEGG